MELSTYDKEMLAIVLSIKKWRPYLLGRSFVIKTDQKSLKYLWDQRISTDAQQHWLSKLIGYDFIIKHKKGVDNIVANALSRQNHGDIYTLSQPVPSWLHPIQEETTSDPTLQHLIKLINDGEAVGPWRHTNGVLFFKDRIYLLHTSELIPQIIKEFHTTTHEGFP